MTPDPSPEAARVRVWPVAPESEARASQLAESLRLPLHVGPLSVTSGKPDLDVAPAADADLLLAVTTSASDGRLELREPSGDAAGAVFADFTGGAVDFRRRRGGGRRDPIARALGIGAGTETILDATAGLGRDAFLFAWLGCRVTAVERSLVVAALLEDALRRARGVPDVREILEQRLALVCGDARAVLAGLTETQRPDAVYIDPMYPPRRSSALVKKEMRMLRRVVGADEDAGELLAIARQRARRRVVVKRHVRSPALELPPPSFSRAGRSTRFDVYLASGPA